MSEDILSIMVFLVMLSLVCLAIVLRMTIGYESSAWEEVARFLSLWFYLFGVAIASKEDSHLRMSFLDNKIKSEKFKLKMEVVFKIAMLVSMGLFFIWSFQYLKWSIDSKQKSLVLILGMWVVHLSFLVGSFLSMIHIFIHFVKSIQNLRDYVEDLKQ